MLRILLAGIVAGIVVFLWGFVAHVLLPLGMVGWQNLPNEDAIVPVLEKNLQQPGLYMFPGMAKTEGMTKEQKEAAEQAWAKRSQSSFSGVLVIPPQGRAPMSGSQLGGEFLTDVLGGLIAAILVAMGGGLGGFGSRVFFVTLLGLFASIAIDFSYWIWYGFPSNYTLAALTDQVVGWFCGGLAIAAIVTKPAGAMRRSTAA